MKKFRTFTIAAMLFFSFMAFASETEPKLSDPEVRAEQIELRVQEIWKMDFSTMENVEKMQLRKELKSLKKELKTEGLDSKVSISLGAIIIILLILIIIT